MRAIKCKQQMRERKTLLAKKANKKNSDYYYYFSSFAFEVILNRNANNEGSEAKQSNKKR